MAEIRLSTRGNDFSRNGLLSMLRGVFSDEDTSGNNGEEYLRFFVKGKWEKSDDEYMAMKLSDEELNENQVIMLYAEWYQETMINSCSIWQDYDVAYDDKGRAVAISYAYY